MFHTSCRPPFPPHSCRSDLTAATGVFNSPIWHYDPQPALRAAAAQLAGSSRTGSLRQHKAHHPETWKVSVWQVCGRSAAACNPLQRAAADVAAACVSSPCASPAQPCSTYSTLPPPEALELCPPVHTRTGGQPPEHICADALPRPAPCWGAAHRCERRGARGQQALPEGAGRLGRPTAAPRKPRRSSSPPCIS
jgi:hypothetical protein